MRDSWAVSVSEEGGGGAHTPPNPAAVGAARSPPPRAGDSALFAGCDWSVIELSRVSGAGNTFPERLYIH